MFDSGLHEIMASEDGYDSQGGYECTIGDHVNKNGLEEGIAGEARVEHPWRVGESN